MEENRTEKFCPCCGRPLPEQALFCSGCGSAVPASPVEPEAPAAPVQRPLPAPGSVLALGIGSLTAGIWSGIYTLVTLLMVLMLQPETGILLDLVFQLLLGVAGLVCAIRARQRARLLPRPLPAAAAAGKNLAIAALPASILALVLQLLTFLITIPSLA